MFQKATFVSLILLFSFVQSPAYSFTRKQKGRKVKVNAKLPTTVPYSMKGPKGWYLINDPEQLPQKVKFVYVGSGKGQFTPSINLATEETENTSSEYLALARKYHEGQSNTYCESLGQLATSAGAAELLQIERDTGFGKVRFIQAVLVRDKTAFVITATALAEEYSEFYPAFFEAVRSFTIARQ